MHFISPWRLLFAFLAHFPVLLPFPNAKSNPQSQIWGVWTWSRISGEILGGGSRRREKSGEGKEKERKKREEKKHIKTECGEKKEVKIIPPAYVCSLGILAYCDSNPLSPFSSVHSSQSAKSSTWGPPQQRCRFSLSSPSSSLSSPFFFCLYPCTAHFLSLIAILSPIKE